MLALFQPYLCTLNNDFHKQRVFLTYLLLLFQQSEAVAAVRGGIHGKHLRTQPGKNGLTFARGKQVQQE